MAHVQANIIKFYSRLEDHRLAEKYTDVTIRCEDEEFECHRIILSMASNVFDTMFSSKFKESTENIVSLPETDAETFKEIVRFIYTGDLLVTFSNLCGLLEASEYFELPGVEDLCAQFIEKNEIGVRNTWRAFMFACRTDKENLMVKLSNNIVKHFRIFSRANEFLEIPFQAFHTILSHWSSERKEELKIGAIVRWVQHTLENRVQHISDLVKMVRFGNVLSDEYVQLIFSKLMQMANPTEASSLAHIIKPIGFNDIQESPILLEATDSKKLHVYVRCGDDNSMRVFSIYRDKNNMQWNCNVTSVKKLMNDTQYQWVRNVSLDDQLYCLHHSRRDPDESAVRNQAFNAYHSVDMDMSLSLTSPPLIFEDVSLCTLRNNIYGYHKKIFHPLTRTCSTTVTSFSDEEVNRGIYSYNCELDNWFPVPALKKQLEDSCMVGWNDQILFLMGGTNPHETGCERYAQAYDYRVGKWDQLPSSKTHFVGADCCVYENEIYICGDGFEKFNPTAWKWECIKSLPVYYPRVISYPRTTLWAIGSLDGGITNNLSSVFQQSVQYKGSGSWCISSILTDCAQRVLNTKVGVIIDAVVF